MPPLKNILIVVLLAPVAEELFFRGVVQSWLKIRFNGQFAFITYANIITSFIFAVIHIPYWGIFHALLVFLPSLIFGFLYDKTGKIHYSVILHIFYNLNIFIV